MATKEQVKPKNLAGAMIQAQQNMPKLFNVADNPFHKSKYAPLSEVTAAAIPALNKAGIAVMNGCNTRNEDGNTTVYVSLRFVHADSGEEWAEEMGMNVLPDKYGKITPQAIGSVITYARRYLLTTMSGLASMDDDGNEASQVGQQPQQKQPQQRKAAPKQPVKKNEPPEFVVANEPDADAVWAVDELPEDIGKDVTPAIQPISDKQKSELHAVGTELHAKEWNTKRPELVLSITKGRTDSSSELTADEAASLISSMRSAIPRDNYVLRFEDGSEQTLENVTQSWAKKMAKERGAKSLTVVQGAFA